MNPWSEMYVRKPIKHFDYKSFLIRKSSIIQVLRAKVAKVLQYNYDPLDKYEMITGLLMELKVILQLDLMDQVGKDQWDQTAEIFFLTSAFKKQLTSYYYVANFLKRFIVNQDNLIWLNKVCESGNSRDKFEHDFYQLFQKKIPVILKTPKSQQDQAELQKVFPYYVPKALTYNHFQNDKKEYLQYYKISASFDKKNENISHPNQIIPICQKQINDSRAKDKSYPPFWTISEE